MKKLLALSLFLCLLFGTALYAQVDITIGTGTSSNTSTGAPTPYGTYYKNFRQQYLYTAAEIEAAGGGAGPINSLAFNVANVNTCSAMPNFTIRIKETSQTVLSGAFEVGTYTQVFYQNNFVPVNGWNVHTFDSPFTWDGSSNLIVDIVTTFIPGSYTQNASVFFTPTTGTNTALRYQNDTTDAGTYTGTGTTGSPNRANIIFNMSELTIVDPPSAATIISPADAATNVELNQTLNWAAGTGMPTGYKLYYSTTNPPAYIGDLGSELSYNPGTLNYSTTYYWQVIPYNTNGDATGCPVWTFTTMDDPIISSYPYSQNFDGPWVNSPAAPIGWQVINANSDDYQWSQDNTYIDPTHSTPYAAHGMGNTDDWLISPPIDLTGVNVRMKWWDVVESAGFPNSYKVLLSTTDTAPASFTVELADITCVNIDWMEHTINLDAYTGQTVYLAFHQYASAATYYGFGIDDFLAEEIPETPILTHSPTSIAFPYTKAGESSAAQNVTVTNTGGSVLTLSSEDISMDGMTGDFDFSTMNLPANLSAGQSVTIPVYFTPQSAGDFTATLLINYESVNYEVDLTGTAYPDTYVFEGFEGASFPPAGWANPGSWSSSSTAYEGTKSAYKYGSSSTPYILSTPKLEINTGDALLFMGRVSSITSAIDIIYSQDRTSWTVLETLTAPTSSVWLPVALDLTPIVGAKATGNYYIGFRPMGSASYYIDNVVMPPFALEAPEAVTLTAPANAAINQSLLPTLTWTTALTGGIPTSFDVYLEASEDPESDPRVLLANVPASPYTLTTPLSYSTSYIWKVVAKNAYGDAPASVIRSFTTMADPTKPLPYSQDFNSGTSLATIGWTGTMSITSNHGTEGSNGLYKNMWSSAPTANGVTPPIGPMTDGVALSFDYRIVNYTGYPANATTLGASDKVEVQISTDSGASYSTIHTIDQSNHLSSAAFAPVTVDLSAYNSGNIMLKFLCTWGAGDYYVDIDNVLVRVPPANPIFAVDPTEKDFGIVNLGDTSSQVFTISNQGAGTLSIESVSLTGDTDHFNLTDVNTYPVDLTIGQSMQISVSFSPIAVGQHSATLSVRDNLAKSKGENTVNIIGEGYDATISSFPWAENFENASFPPVGWTTADLDGGGSYWTATTSYNHTTSGSKSAGHTYSSSTPDQDGWLVSPPLTLPADKDMVLSFWNYNQYPSDMVYNGVLINSVADPNDLGWVELWSADSPTQSWTQEQISITAYAGQTIFLAFVYQGYNADAWYVDDLEVYESYDYPEDTPITVGEGEDAVTVTVSGGSANNVPGGEIPDIPNGTFVSAGSFVLELLGAGPWTVTIETDAPWGAYFKDGAWTAVENVGGFITFDINADKSLTTPIILGPVDPTLPVTLSSFTAVLTADMHVNLTWVAETEVDHAGYNVLRSEVKELSTAIFINTSLIDEGQNVGTQVKYNFLDKEVYHNAVYYYWLENVDLNGETEYYGPITAYVNADGEGPGIPEIPLETKLFAAFPNPFNPATNLRYSMKEAGDVRIDVFNVKGQILKTYHNSHNLPGYYQVNWDGRDLNGRPVSTGVYFYRMTSGNYSSTKKMVMAK